MNETEEHSDNPADDDPTDIKDRREELSLPPPPSPDRGLQPPPLHGVESTDPAGPGRIAAVDPSAHTEIGVGLLVDNRFEIVREISHGAMARIYEAEQVSVHRRVALKIIGREFTKDSQAITRFRREAAILAKIQHPNIVTVHDIGTTLLGEPFIAMEFVDGPSLAEVVRKRGRLPPVDAVSLLLQIARALGTVHERGVIHRDLKPGNILLATGPSGVVVAKIADFGLAKVVDDRRLGEFLTRAGTILGTPEYMSPEQIRGGEIDARADLYSLGCLAYELFTGAPPFVAADEMSTLYRHLHERPLAMNKACPEARIPAPFQTLVEHALMKEANDRVPTAFEFYRGLLRAADQTGIPRSKLRLVESLFDDPAYAKHHYQGPAAPLETARRRQRRLERWLLTATLVVLALVAGIVIARGGLSSPSPIPLLAGDLLVITSRPTGAQVVIDDTPTAETTPTAIRGLAPGPHQIAVKKDGYGDATRSIEVVAGERYAIDVALAPHNREVVLESVPSGAQVYIDNHLAAVSTPTTVALEVDSFHQIRLEKPGYEPLVYDLTPDHHEPRLELALEVEKRPIGAVWVFSNDAAEIWVDGADTGFITPSLGIRVAAGEHTVELRDPMGGRSKPARVKVGKGENIHLTLRVER